MKVKNTNAYIVRRTENTFLLSNLKRVQVKMMS